MHSLTVANRPKWFMFETSCYAFGGRIRSFAKVNVNVLQYRINSRCRLFLSMYTFIILTIRLFAWCNWVNAAVERNTPAHYSTEWRTKSGMCDHREVDSMSSGYQLQVNHRLPPPAVWKGRRRQRNSQRRPEIPQRRLHPSSRRAQSAHARWRQQEARAVQDRRDAQQQIQWEYHKRRMNIVGRQPLCRFHCCGHYIIGELFHIHTTHVGRQARTRLNMKNRRIL